MIDLLNYDLIGISGPIGSGKDTIASLIVVNSDNQYQTVSFAEPLREAAKVMFGWTDFEVTDRVAKETVDPFWGFSPRTALQYLGTEYGRKLLRDDVWIRAAQRKMEAGARHGKRTVIQDVRFPNEDEWVRSYGERSLRIFVTSNEDPPVKTTHVSEQGLSPRDGRDVIFYNDKSLGLAGLVNAFNKLFSFNPHYAYNK